MPRAAAPAREQVTPTTPLRLSPRRGLRLDDAAAYVGLSRTKFLALIQDGRMPSPIPVDGCRVWDVRDLDDAFDRLKGEDDVRPNSWDDA